MNKNLNYIEEGKIENINLIVDLIRRNERITRVMLADMTKLTRMSITRIVALLLDKGIIYEKGEVSAARGRPAKMLHINPKRFYSLSINIDVDKVIMAIINLNQEIILRKTIDVKLENSMEDYVERIFKEFKIWEKEHFDITKKVECIVFISPGIIDPRKGEIVFSAQLGWKNENIVKYAKDKFGIKVLVDNDVKTALLGELAHLELTDKSNIAYMAIGHGVGVGLWLDGEILRGANNNAGEIGHISIDYNGELCNCGRKGCLDTVLSIKSILKKANNIDPKIESMEDIAKKFESKETWAIDLVDDMSRYFSIALNNIVYTYDPDKILIGGLLFERFPNILEIMTKSKYFKIYAEYIKNINIQSAKLGKQAYLIGGAIRAQDYLLEKITL
ncbi:MAG: ROK family protein [Tissierellia bacterium]|nr:ROK family protein [Tissierellia bacterium]